MERDIMLEVKDLHVYYDNIHALKGISLKVGKGEVVSVRPPGIVSIIT